MKKILLLSIILLAGCSGKKVVISYDCSAVVNNPDFNKAIEKALEGNNRYNSTDTLLEDVKSCYCKKTITVIDLSCKADNGQK